MMFFNPSHWSLHAHHLCCILSKLFRTLMLQNSFRGQKKKHWYFYRKAWNLRKVDFKDRLERFAMFCRLEVKCLRFIFGANISNFLNFFSADQIYRPEVFPNERSWVELFLTRRCGDFGKAYSTIRLIRSPSTRKTWFILNQYLDIYIILVKVRKVCGEFWDVP